MAYVTEPRYNPLTREWSPSEHGPANRIVHVETITCGLATMDGAIILGGYYEGMTSIDIFIEVCQGDYCQIKSIWDEMKER